jgi:hypothetical protein
MKVTIEVPPIGDYRRTHLVSLSILVSLIDSVGEKIIAKELLAEAH